MPTFDHTSGTEHNHHASNCRSFLRLARRHIVDKDWSRATDCLRAAIRSANRAGARQLAGRCMTALQHCQRASAAEIQMAEAA